MCRRKARSRGCLEVGIPRLFFFNQLKEKQGENYYEENQNRNI